MKYLQFARTFFRLFGRYSGYAFTDSYGCIRYDPPRHLWKNRIGFGLAWSVAKRVWL